MSDNKKNKRMVEVDLGDVLMLMEAARLAGNTAMMSSKRDAEKRLRKYQKMFDDLIPPAAREFSGTDFSEIAQALQTASTYHIFLERPDPSRSWFVRPNKGHVIVEIDGRRWKTKSWDIEANGTEHTAIQRLLQEISPVSCKQVEHTNPVTP